MIFYHYTCAHSAPLIVAAGAVEPLASVAPYVLDDMPPALSPIAYWSWWTDLDYPFRDALGLTARVLVQCDRTAYRFQARDSHNIQPWITCKVRHRYPLTRSLERAPGALPRHWYVASWPVAVTAA